MGKRPRRAIPGVSGDVVLVLPQIQLFLRLDFFSEMLPGLWGNRVERGIGDRTENRVKIREKVVFPADCVAQTTREILVLFFSVLQLTKHFLNHL